MERWREVGGWKGTGAHHASRVKVPIAPHQTKCNDGRSHCHLWWMWVASSKASSGVIAEEAEAHPSLTKITSPIPRIPQPSFFLQSGGETVLLPCKDPFLFVLIYLPESQYELFFFSVPNRCPDICTLKPFSAFADFQKMHSELEIGLWWSNIYLALVCPGLLKSLHPSDRCCFAAVLCFYRASLGRLTAAFLLCFYCISLCFTVLLLCFIVFSPVNTDDLNVLCK